MRRRRPRPAGRGTHAPSGTMSAPGPAVGLPRHVARSARALSRRRPPASRGTWRGLLWSSLVAVAFVVLSHPREVIPDFSQSLLYVAVPVLLVVLVDVRAVRPPTVPWTVAVFLLLCAASLLWSVSPDDTAHALALYGGIALFACLAVGNTETSVLLRGIMWGAVLIAVAAVWAVGAGFEWAGGPIGEAPLRGVNGNRNIVSYTLVLGLAAALSNRPLASGRAWRRIARWAAWGAAPVVLVSVLFLTRSGTGLAAAAVLLVAAVALAVARGTRLFATLLSKVVGATVAVLLLLLASAAAQAVFTLLGRRTDFSGRVPLWRAIVDVWSEAPVLGYGWGAIWPYSWFMPETASAAKDQIDVETGYWLSHGHNIVFDLLPQLGILGVALLVLMVGCSVGWLFVPLNNRDYVVARWATLGVLALLVNGVSEPMLSVPVGWFTLVAIAAGTARLRSRVPLDR